MPPEVRGDDYKHPLSVHGSNKKWIVIAAVIILGVLAVGLMLRANETTSDDNVPLTGFRPQLSYEETVGEYIASPEPTYSVLAVVENIGEDAGSLDDWNVHVKLEVNRGVVAEDREYLKGSLGPDETWDIPFELKIDELETGDKIRLLVYLRDEEDGRYSSRMIRQTITEE